MKPSPSDAVNPKERTTWLTVLASRLANESVTAHITHDNRLFVQKGTAKDHVTAAPDDRTGEWCYWFGADYIAAAGDLEKTAARIAKKLTLDAFSMPDPADITCTSCGQTFTADRTSQAAKDKLCADCAVPGARGL